MLSCGPDEESWDGGWCGALAAQLGRCRTASLRTCSHARSELPVILQVKDLT